VIYPEKINRRLTDHCLDYSFAPTEKSKKTLVNEGIYPNLGKKAKIDFLPRHPADVLATCADIGKAERLLGWRAVEWHLNNSEMVQKLHVGRD